MDAEKAPVVEETDPEIDIFLFSNGQEYSPPRKYHLKASELSYWKTTLSYLARSQYGSLHSSIDLYELNGRKVETPEEVRDCAVYVAVVPPDPFIHSGYDKYLVKASRSWEKRLAKRLNGVETTNQGFLWLFSFVIFFFTVGLSNPKNFIQEENEQRPPIPTGYPRRSSDVPNPLLKTDKLKPVANQVSQRSNNPRKLSPATGESIYQTKTDKKKDFPPKNTKNSKQVISHRNSGSGTVIKCKPFLKSGNLDQRSTNAQRNTKTINSKIQDKINKPYTRGSTEKKRTLHSTTDEPTNKSNANPSKQPVVNNIPKITVKEIISAYNEKAQLSNKELNISRKNRINDREHIDLTQENIAPIAETSLVSDKESIVKTEEKIANTNLNSTISKELNEIIDKASVTNTSLKAKSQVHVQKNDMDQITVSQESTVTNHQTHEIAKGLNTTDKTSLVESGGKISNADMLSVKQNESKVVNMAADAEKNSVPMSSKLKGSVVEVAPKAEYIDTVVLKKDTENKEVKVIPLLDISNKQTGDARNILEESSEVVYDIKVPLLYYVPEKTINQIAIGNTGNNMAQTEGFSEEVVILPPKASILYELDGIDLKNNTKNTSSSPVNSTGHNSVKLQDEDNNQDTGNIYFDKDNIQRNIFKNSTSDAISTFVDANGIRISTENKGNTDNSVKVTSHDEISYFDSKCITNTGTSTNNYLQLSGVWLVHPKNGKENTKVTLKVPANTPEIAEIEQQPDSHQFIAFMPNGDIVELKLSIQVMNKDSMLKTMDYTNTLKSNYDSDNKTPNELTGSKSLQSIERVPLQPCCRNDNVVVYRCACCSPNNGDTTRQADLLGYYIMLPVIPLPGGKSAKETHLHVSDKQAQTTESLMNLEVSSVKETTVTLTADSDTNKLISSTIEIERSQMTGTIETSTITEVSQMSVRFATQDQSSQTEWCDVLLEARPEPDGHYTFYLPPLQVLREYKLRQ